MVEDECLVSEFRAVFSVSKQQTCETPPQFGSRGPQVALSMDKRIVRENETRTPEFAVSAAMATSVVRGILFMTKLTSRVE